jgi:hypothetical protein
MGNGLFGISIDFIYSVELAFEYGWYRHPGMWKSTLLIISAPERPEEAQGKPRPLAHYIGSAMRAKLRV